VATAEVQPLPSTRARCGTSSATVALIAVACPSAVDSFAAGTMPRAHSQLTFGWALEAACWPKQAAGACRWALPAWWCRRVASGAAPAGETETRTVYTGTVVTTHNTSCGAGARYVASSTAQSVLALSTGATRKGRGAGAHSNGCITRSVCGAGAVDPGAWHTTCRGAPRYTAPALTLFARAVARAHNAACTEGALGRTQDAAVEVGYAHFAVVVAPEASRIALVADTHTS